MTVADARPLRGPSRAMNGPGHLRCVTMFMIMVGAHWLEHLVQAFQIYVLGMPIPRSLGLIGQLWPWLFRTELLHWGYAALMLAGLIMMRHSFAGRARLWWNVALWIQVWHFFEHLLLLAQAWSGVNLFGASVPTSVIQLVVPRVELHLIYNTIVTVPIVMAVAAHWFGRRTDSARLAEALRCTCAARFVKPAS